MVDGLLCSADYLLILHARHPSECPAVPVERLALSLNRILVYLWLVEQAVVINGSLLVGGIGSIYFDEFRVSDDLLQTVHADFAEIFAHLFS